MTTVFRTYADYYALPANDRNWDNYERILSSFQVNEEDAPTSTELLDQVLASTSIPQVFACAALNSDKSTRIYLLHRPQRIVAPLGGDSQWDKHIFATNGEVLGNFMVTVQLPANPFNVTPVLTVRTADEMNEFFMEYPESAHATPVPAANAAQAEAYKTRNMMYFPSILICPEILLSQGTKPRRFWELVYNRIVTLDRLDEMEVLIDWMKAAAHLQRSNGRAVLPLTLPALVVPMIDTELHHARERIVNNDLTARFNQMTGVQDSILRLAAVVADNTTRTVSLQSEEKAKTPAKLWPQTLDLLLRYTEVTRENELPKLYESIAKASKSERRIVMQQAMTSRANSPNAFCVQPVVVNLGLAKCIYEFDFAASDPDNLSQGLQPFILNLGNAEQRARTLENAQQFDELEGGTVGLNLQDLRALKANEHKHIPLTFMELDVTLGSFGDLLEVLLGTNHTLYTSFLLFWKEWQRFRLSFSTAIDITRTLKPVHLMRRLQLELYFWFDAKRQALNPLPVDFRKVIHEINMATFIPPTLPATLMLESLAATVTTSNPTTPVGLMAPSIHGSLAQFSDLSTITDFMSSFQNATKTTQQGSGDVVINPNPDQELNKALDGNRIRVICKPPFPQNAAKQDMCISYHAKGRCFSLCGRAADHKPHSDKETAILRSYVEAQVLQFRTKKTGATVLP